MPNKMNRKDSLIVILYSLSNNQCLHLSQFKTFAEDKLILYVSKKKKKKKNTTENGKKKKNAGTCIFSIYHNVFKMPLGTCF